LSPTKNASPAYVTLPLRRSSTTIEVEHRVLVIDCATILDCVNPIIIKFLPAIHAPIHNSKAKIKATVGQYN